MQTRRQSIATRLIGYILTITLVLPSLAGASILGSMSHDIKSSVEMVSHPCQGHAATQRGETGGEHQGLATTDENAGEMNCEFCAMCTSLVTYHLPRFVYIGITLSRASPGSVLFNSQTGFKFYRPPLV